MIVYYVDGCLCTTLGLPQQHHPSWPPGGGETSNFLNVYLSTKLKSHGANERTSVHEHSVSHILLLAVFQDRVIVAMQCMVIQKVRHRLGCFVLADYCESSRSKHRCRQAHLSLPPFCSCWLVGETVFTGHTDSP